MIATKNGTPLYIVDGKEEDSSYLIKLNPDNIERMDVLKDENAVLKYGAKGKNGVVIITTKKTHAGTMQKGSLQKTGAATTQTAAVDDKIFTKVENEPDFIGGIDAWKNT